jgi:hypothetical protein
MGSRAINCFILGKIGQDKKTLRWPWTSKLS